MSALSSAGGPALARNRRVDQYVLVLIVVTVAAVAWVLLSVLHGDGHSLSSEPSAAAGGHGEHAGGAHAHHQPVSSGGTGGTPIVSQAAHAVAGWVLMVIAMMLPPALPLLQTVRRLVANRPMAPFLTLLSAGTFVAAWTVVGAVLVAGYLLIHGLAGGSLATTDLAWVAGAVVVFAGIYQFTPLKDLCLRGCRSPRSFVLAHWQGRRTAPAELFALTGAYAVSCIGCCWALMLICFAVGTAALPVMVALTVVMAAERLVSWGRRLVRPVGVALIALGLGIGAVPMLSGLPLL